MQCFEGKDFINWNGIKMNIKYVGLMMFIIMNLFGCSSFKITINNKDTAKYIPIGIYILSSSQVLDAESEEHKSLIVEYSTKVIDKYLSVKNYSLVFLNDKLSQTEVFKKYFGSFNIDEKIVAKYAFITK